RARRGRGGARRRAAGTAVLLLECDVDRGDGGAAAPGGGASSAVHVLGRLPLGDPAVFDAAGVAAAPAAAALAVHGCVPAGRAVRRPGSRGLSGTRARDRGGRRGGGEFDG